MIFATLVLERDPMRWEDLRPAVETWVRDAGGFAAVALLLYAIFYLIQRPGSGGTKPRSGLQKTLIRLALLAAIAGYGVYAILSVFSPGGASVQPTRRASLETLTGNSLLLGAGGALAVVLLPFLIDLVRVRWRRIWALAKLSFKEAIRRRVLWVFSGMILVFLFASWFLDYKPENQVRNYVRVVYWAMAPLMLVTAGLMASFSIPADVRNQTIHTIVTKPVERFEIVIGRFVGYMLLLTLVLVGLTGVSYLYVLREIDPDAKFESMRARVPLYGTLGFQGKEATYQGTDVGREWTYRRYISGGSNSPERAIWTYRDLPRHLADRDEPTVTCEFSFDIFRTLKGEEGKGVLCSFLFRTPHWDQARAREYEQAKEKARDALRVTDRRTQIEQAYRDIRGQSPKPEEVNAFVSNPDAGAPQRLLDNLLSEEFGIYEVRNKVVLDYHTQALDLPSGLFKSAFGQQHPASPSQGEDPGALLIMVKCDSAGQYLGAAKYDFYILDAERPFWWNFFKGAAGLWLRLCVVVGLGIALSTYLSGVIAWLTTMFIYIAGLVQDVIMSIASGQNVGGGPMEALYRLANRENMAVPLDSTPSRNLALTLDIGYRWVLRRFLNILPDVDRFDWTDYVAEGFNISSSNTLLLSTVVVAAYLLPWAILAYYLMKSREVAA
jgi:ABC-type transport system involved in multi-copper enzyme maturation permease subunit